MKTNFEIDIKNFIKLTKDNPKINAFSKDAIQAVLFEIQQTQIDSNQSVDWLSFFESSQEIDTKALATNLIAEYGDYYVQELQQIAINLRLMQQEVSADNHLTPILFDAINREFGLLENQSFQQAAIEYLTDNEEIPTQHLFNGNWLLFTGSPLKALS